MSRSFLGFGQVAYIGQPYTRPAKYRGIAGVVCPLFFQWLAYGASSALPNINILVNLETAACKNLDQIRSVYIDNLGSANPVYVYFPDTGETISAKANSEGWYPAFTNAKQIWVVGQGFLTGSIPQTFILLSNLPIEAAVNTELDQSASLYLASPVITRGSSIYNTALGIPALGDQLFSSAFLQLNGVGNGVILFGSPYPSGFIILTSLIVNVIGTSSAAPQTNQLIIESVGIAGTLIAPVWQSQAVVPNIPAVSLVNMYGLQTKLDATQGWRARVAPPASLQGVAQIYASFTQTP